jgi:transcriptional regulator
VAEPAARFAWHNRAIRENPAFATDDVDVVRQLIRESPWATLVSHHDGGLVASHYPILLDEDSPELAVVSHVGKPDEELHGLGRHEVLLIVQGRHGYVSPSWYAPEDPPIPTWNFTVAHCYGTPEVLEADANLRVLTRLTEHFERRVQNPALLDPEFGARVARGTVGYRMAITRFVCKVKLSQNRSPDTRRRVIAALREPGPYHHPELAAEMERVLNAE